MKWILPDKPEFAFCTEDSARDLDDWREFLSQNDRGGDEEMQHAIHCVIAQDGVAKAKRVIRALESRWGQIKVVRTGNEIDATEFLESAFKMLEAGDAREDAKREEHLLYFPVEEAAN